MEKTGETLDPMKKIFPEKFAAENKIFHNIHRGDHIFISTAAVAGICGH